MKHSAETIIDYFTRVDRQTLADNITKRSDENATMHVNSVRILLRSGTGHPSLHVMRCIRDYSGFTLDEIDVYFVHLEENPYVAKKRRGITGSINDQGSEADVINVPRKMKVEVNSGKKKKPKKAVGKDAVGKLKKKRKK